MAEKSKLIIGIIGVILLLLISVFLLQIFNQQDEKKGHDRYLGWEKTVSILNSGNVKEVFQSHDLSVTLVLENGTKARTTEPEIDEIFHEVDKCEKPCEDIILATE
ncbi:MAG: hypothetical protein ACQESF_03940 [Nanobdellota archaeon]